MRRIKGLLLLSVSLILVSGCNAINAKIDWPWEVYYSVEYELNGERFEYTEHDPVHYSLSRGQNYRKPSFSAPEDKLQVHFVFNNLVSPGVLNSLDRLDSNNRILYEARFSSDTTFFVAGKKYYSSLSDVWLYPAGEMMPGSTKDLVFWLEKGQGDVSFSVCFECKKIPNSGTEIPFNKCDTIYCTNGRIDIYNRCPIDNPHNYDFLRTE